MMLKLLDLPGIHHKFGDIDEYIKKYKKKKINTEV